MRYALFAGDQYYPAGGWQDYKGSYDSLTQALKAAAGDTRNTDLQGKWDWWHIVDLETGKMVEEGVSEVIRRSPDQEED